MVWKPSEENVSKGSEQVYEISLKGQFMWGWELKLDLSIAGMFSSGESPNFEVVLI